MKKEIIEQIKIQLLDLEQKGFKFNRKKVSFESIKEFGTISIKFHEYMELDSKLRVSLCIRFNVVENIINKYKIDSKLMNPNYANDSVTISVNLEKLIGNEFFLDYQRNLMEQLKPFIETKILPFFNEYSNLKNAEKLFYFSDLLTYVEPPKSFGKVVFSFLNHNNTEKIITECFQILNSLNGASVKMYLPTFNRLCKDVQECNVKSL